MNKIKVVNNRIIPFISDDVTTYDNSIIFKENGNYFIEYITSDDIDISINICDNKCIHLFEYSSNENVSFNINYELGNKSNIK